MKNGAPYAEECIGKFYQNTLLIKIKAWVFPKWIQKRKNGRSEAKSGIKCVSWGRFFNLEVL